MTNKSKRPFIRRHFKKLLLLFIAISTAAAFLLYNPAKEIFKSWNAERLAKDAQEYADDEDWDNAKRTAIASLQNERTFEAFRILAKASIESGDVGALQSLYTLFSHEEAETSDRALALEHTLELGDFKGVAEMISLLTDEDRKNPDIRYQEVKWLLRSGQAPEAITLADTEIDGERDPALDLLLAQGVAASGLEGAREVTTDRLIRVMNSDDRELALEALNYLPALQDSWIYSPLAKSAIKRFENDPDLSIAQNLVVDFLKIGLDKSTHEEIVKKAIANYKDEGLAELIAWLKRLGKAKEVIELTESEQARSDSTLFSERLNALERLSLWEQLEEELANPPVAIPEPMLFSAQAIAAFRNDDQLKFIQSWEDAVAAAQRDLEKNWFAILAVSAQRLGDVDRQMDALAQSITHPLGNPPRSTRLSPLFKWILDRGETERLLKITETLRKGEPDSPLLTNNLVYLKALHGKVDRDDVVRLQKWIETFPEQGSLLNSLALAHLRAKEPQAAVDALAKISADPAELTSTGRAILANAKFDLGQEEEAFLIADTIRWKDLNQAEIALLAIARPQ